MTSKQVEFTVEKRVLGSKNANKKMRLSGKVPGIYYGKGVSNIQVTIEEKGLVKILSADGGMNSIFNLDIAGQKQAAIVCAIDEDPISGRVLHVDFQHIDLAQKIKAHVPLKIVGIAPAVKLGAILQQNLHSVNIRCLPLEIPAHIDVDIALLEKINDSIKISDIVALKGMEVLDDAHASVVMATPPVVEEAAVSAAETAAAAAEPELIKKGKKDEDAEDAGKDAKAGSKDAGAKPAAKSK